MKTSFPNNNSNYFKTSGLKVAKKSDSKLCSFMVLNLPQVRLFNDAFEFALLVLKKRFFANLVFDTLFSCATSLEAHQVLHESILHTSMMMVTSRRQHYCSWGYVLLLLLLPPHHSEATSLPGSPTKTQLGTIGAKSMQITNSVGL